MTEETNIPSEFSQTPPEPSEKELVQNRINNYRVGVKPNVAQIVNALLESHLKNGLVQLNELEAIVAVRDDVTQGLAEYNLAVETATRRLNEIVQEEAIAKTEELEERRLREEEKLVQERQLRKSLEDRLARLEALLSESKSAVENIDDTDYRQPPDPMESWEKWTPPTLSEDPEPQPEPQPKKPKSKAWDMVRASRPDSVAEDGATIPQSETTVPFSTDEELVEKVEETKKAFKDFAEEVKESNQRPSGLYHHLKTDEEHEERKSIDDATPEEWDAAARNLAGISQEDLSELEYEDTLPDLDQLELDFDKPFEDLPEAEEYISGYDANGSPVVEKVEELKIAEEDTETEPSFTKPVVSAGNAPHLREVLSDGDSLKVSTTAETEEELLEKLAEKYEEPEEETVEIVIPSRSDLESLTKSQIKVEGDKLGFDINQTQTKTKMIDSFVEQSEEYIRELTEDEGFVSASTDDEGDDDNTRDGGYF